MDPFLGAWKRTSCIGFEKLAPLLGIDDGHRIQELKDACETITFSKGDGEAFTISTAWGPEKYESQFKLGEEYEEDSVYGKMKSTISIEAKAVKYVQAGAKATLSTTIFIEDDQMISVSGMTYLGMCVRCTRI